MDDTQDKLTKRKMRRWRRQIVRLLIFALGALGLGVASGLAMFFVLHHKSGVRPDLVGQVDPKNPGPSPGADPGLYRPASNPTLESRPVSGSAPEAFQTSHPDLDSLIKIMNGTTQANAEQRVFWLSQIGDALLSSEETPEDDVVLVNDFTVSLTGVAQGLIPDRVIAVNLLIRHLLAAESLVVDRGEIEAYIHEFERLEKVPIPAPRLRVVLARIWLVKILRRFRKDIAEVSLFKPWTVPPMIESGEAFLEAAVGMAERFPRSIDASAWIVLHDTSDMGLEHFDEIYRSYSQFIPQSILDRYKKLEKELIDAESIATQRGDVLGGLLAISIRWSLRGRIPEILVPGSSLSAAEILEMDQRLMKWASPIWLHEPTGTDVRKRILNLNRFVAPDSPGLNKIHRTLSTLEARR